MSEHDEKITNQPIEEEVARTDAEEQTIDSEDAESSLLESVKPRVKMKEIRTEKQAKKALIPKPPKPLPLRTIRIIAISVSSVIAAALVITLCLIYLLPKGVDYSYAFANIHDFRALDCPPQDADKNEIALPYDIEDESKLNENVYFLYTTANKYCKDAEALTVYNKGNVYVTVANQGNIFAVDTVILKTQDYYYFSEHRLKFDVPILESEMFGDVFGDIFVEKGAIISTRKYDEIGGDAALQQQIKGANGTDENDVPFAVWDEADTYKMPKPTYNSAQNNDFSLVSHRLREDWIYDCTLESVQDEETDEEYYHVTFLLDVGNEETTIDSRKEIIDGTGDKKCNYTSILFDATIWKNGAFRTLFITEDWSAKAAGLITTVYHMTHNYHFSYDEEDCDVSAYTEAADLIAMYKGE